MNEGTASSRCELFIILHTSTYDIDFRAFVDLNYWPSYLLVNVLNGFKRNAAIFLMTLTEITNDG